MEEGSRQYEENLKQIKFYNQICYCARRAIIKISETISNPNRIFFTCKNTNKKCGYFEFWPVSGTTSYNQSSSSVNSSKVSMNRKIDRINAKIDRIGIHNQKLNGIIEGSHRKARLHATTIYSY